MRTSQPRSLVSLREGIRRVRYPLLIVPLVVAFVLGCALPAFANTEVGIVTGPWAPGQPNAEGWYSSPPPLALVEYPFPGFNIGELSPTNPQGCGPTTISYRWDGGPWIVLPSNQGNLKVLIGEHTIEAAVECAHGFIDYAGPVTIKCACGTGGIGGQLGDIMPTPPTVTAGTVGFDSVNLSWTGGAGGTFPWAGYVVFDAATGNLLGGLNTGFSATIGGLSWATSYDLYVCTVDTNGYVSLPSNHVYVTTRGAPHTEFITPMQTGTGISLGYGVTLAFSNITGAGNVTVTPHPPGTPPSGFEVNGVYYDIQCDAAFTGPVAVVIRYSTVPVSGEQNFRLFHDLGGGNWEDITSPGQPDTTNHRISGTTFSFSDFAVFGPEAVTYTITATPGLHGSITPAGVTTVSAGGGQTYAITPDPGYHIANLIIDGAWEPASSSYTFAGVTADRTISAVFEANVVSTPASSPWSLFLLAGMGVGAAALLMRRRRTE